MGGLPLLVGADFGISLILIGIALASAILLKPKPKSGITDKEATTTSSRGSFVPYILGYRRTGPSILWVGDREVRKESSGKGKGGLFGPPKQNVFYEAAWHGLCIGPGTALHRIWADGKVIWTGPISSGSHASGSIIQIPGEGDFEIHWGEEIPSGADAFLSAPTRVNVASGWPLLMYVIWRPKKLGLAPRWQNIEYEVEVRPYGTTLAGGPDFLASTSHPLGDDSGCNPAHVLEQYLMSPHPHGMGYSSSLFDIPSLQALSALCVSEQLAISPIIRDGDEFAGAIASIMTDVGLFLPRVDGKIYFKPIRPEGDNYPVLYEDVILSPRPEIDALIGDPESNAIQFGLSDRARAYRPNAIGNSNDGPDIYRDNRSVKRVSIDTVVSFPVAVSISTRRAQEELALDTRLKVISNHTTRDIYPGMVIAVADIPYKLRVLTVKPAQLTQRVEIEAAPDFFGAFTTWEPDLAGSSGGGSPIPVNDSSLVLDSPPWQGGPPTGNVPGEPHPAAVAIIQARSDVQVLGAEIWLSVDDVSYVRMGIDDTTGVAGKLDEDLPVDGLTYLDQGPLVTFDGIDLNLLQDLSTNLLDWSVGRQCLYVGGEILYVQWFEAVSGNQFRARGVYRARRAFGKKAHVTDDRFIVFNPDDLFIVSDALIAAATDIYIKAQPFSWAGPKDLSTITPVHKAVADLSIQVPFGIENLRAPRVRGHYEWALDGIDLTFKWNYRNSVGQRSGAGFQLPGEATAMMPPLGTFELDILLSDHTTVVSSVVGLTAPEYAITWAALEALTGALSVSSQFYIRVRENAFGRFSIWSELLVTVV